MTARLFRAQPKGLNATTTLKLDAVGLLGCKVFLYPCLGFQTTHFFGGTVPALNSRSDLSQLSLNMELYPFHQMLASG